nr:hypothetical protein [Fodinicola feengrottensis]
MPARNALLVAHTGRQENLACAKQVVGQLVEAGFEVRVLTDEASELHVTSRPTEWSTVRTRRPAARSSSRSAATAPCCGPPNWLGTPGCR